MIKEKIIKLIKEKKFNLLLNFLESSILNNLKREDLIDLIKSSEHDLIEIILKTLRLPHTDSIFFYGKQLFSDKIDQYAFQEIKEKIIEIVNRNNINDLAQLIGLDLLKYLNINDLVQLIKKNDGNFTKNYLNCFTYEENYQNELNNYEIRKNYWPNEFFKKLSKKFPDIIEKELINIIESSKDNILEIMVDYELLDFIKKKNLVKLLEKNEIHKKIIEAIKNVEEENKIKITKYEWILRIII